MGRQADCPGRHRPVWEDRLTILTDRHRPVWEDRLTILTDRHRPVWEDRLTVPAHTDQYGKTG